MDKDRALLACERITYPHIHSPVAFFAGALLTMLLLAWAGRAAARVDILADLPRLHPRVCPEGLFYPTADEFAVHAAAQIGRDRIGVIIGGSSVMNGVGQGVDHLWSRHLQEVLGEGYRVVNVTFRGGALQENGLSTFEALSQDPERKLIYVCDATPTSTYGDADGNIHRYVFWDAYYKGLLLPNANREESLRVLCANENRAHYEMRLGAWFNSQLYFSDLWNLIGYRYVFTNYNFLQNDSMFTPLCEAHDTEIPSPFRERYLHSLDAEMANMRSRIQAFTPERCENARNGYQRIIPESQRMHYLLAVMSDSPFYLQKASDDERARYRSTCEQTVEIMRSAGLNAFAIGSDFSPEDYHDRVHLAESGGRKLAEAIAEQVRGIASKLGYTKAATP